MDERPAGLLRQHSGMRLEPILLDQPGVEGPTTGDR